MLEATFINDEVSRDLDEAIAFARAEGLGAIELRMIGDVNVVELPVAELERIRAKLDAAGLRVAALSTPLFKCPLGGEWDDDDPDPFKAASRDFADHLALIPTVVAAAHVLGTEKLRCFAFLGRGAYADVREAIVERLRRAGAALVALDPQLRFCIENEHTTYVRLADEVASLVRELGDPFDVLWDPGNAYASGARQPLLGVEAVAGLVTHVHVKDPTTAGDAVRFVVVGEGAIDYPAQVAAWVAAGYRGYVSLEPHLIVGRSSIPGARACLDYLRPLLAAANAGAA